jgi:hypothetical protein
MYAGRGCTYESNFKKEKRLPAGVSSNYGV